jgi:hypothetical protein
MNQIFSLKRFGMLFKKHTVENYKSYLLSIFVLLGILAISLVLAIYKSKAPIYIDNQAVNYVIFFLLGGTIFTSNVFVNLGDKRKTIATLTLPASSFEKFMVGWVYSFIIFQVLFTALFYGMLVLITSIGNWPADTVHYLNIFDPKQKMYFLFIGYAILHSIVIYGSIYFKKMHFIKTAFAVFIIGGVIWLLNDKVLQALIGHDISGNPPFAGASFRDTDSYQAVDLSDESSKYIYLVFAMLTIIFWTASYFRLKEKQV